MPLYLALGWVSLRLRGVGWRGVGFAILPRWRRALALGAIAGVALEVLSFSGAEPPLARLFGKTEVGNSLALVLIDLGHYPGL